MNLDKIYGRTETEVKDIASSIASAFLFGLTYAGKFEWVDEAFVDHFVAYRVQVFQLDQRSMDVMEAYKAFKTLVVDRDTAPPNPPCLADAKG